MLTGAGLRSGRGAGWDVAAAARTAGGDTWSEVISRSMGGDGAALCLRAGGDGSERMVSMESGGGRGITAGGIMFTYARS